MKDDIQIDVDKVDAAASRGTALSFPRTAISDRLEAFIKWTGYFFAFIWIPLILLIVLNVILRYVFRESIIAMEEMQWHLYAIGFMMALAYTIQADGHVRVDVLAERFTLRRRAWIELIGILCLMLPFALVVLYWGYPFVERAHRVNEVSAAPGGLPMRWVIKSFILWGFGLVVIAAVARLLRVTAYLFGLPRPRPHTPQT